MFISFVRRLPIVVLCTSFSLTFCGCSEPGPVEEANDKKPQEEVAVVAIAPSFAPQAGRPAVPGGGANFGATNSGAGSNTPGSTGYVITPIQTTLFNSQITTAPGGQPVLYPGRLTWYDPQTDEPCKREIGVASNGDLALLEPFSLVTKTSGPMPKIFPIHAVVDWYDYRTDAWHKMGGRIESLDVVRISGTSPDASALRTATPTVPTQTIPTMAGPTMAGPMADMPSSVGARPQYVSRANPSGGPDLMEVRAATGSTGRVPKRNRIQRPSAQSDSSPAAAAGPQPLPVDETIQLSGQVTEAQSGAGGRYLVLAIPSQSQVVVVDVPEMKIAKTIPTSDGMLIAAGKTKFVIVDRRDNMLTRYNFATLEEEQSQSVGKNFPAMIAMSEFGDGPLWVIDAAKTEDAPASLRLFDLQKLTPMVVNVSPALRVDLLNVKRARSASVSTAGDVIYLAMPNTSAIVWRNSGGKIDRVNFPTDSEQGVRPVGLSVRVMPDGESFLQKSAFVHGTTKVRYPPQNEISFPFAESRDCISVGWDQQVPRSLVVNYRPGAAAVATAEMTLAALGDSMFGDFQFESNAVIQNQRLLNLARRFNYDPTSKIFSFITSSPNSVAFKKFNPSDHGATPRGETNRVAQPHEIFAEIRLDPEAPPLAWPVTTQKPVAVDATLPLAGEVIDAQVGADGRYLLLTIPSKGHVVVVDVPNMKIAKEIPVVTGKMAVAAGKTKFVILDVGAKTLTRYDFETLEKEQKAEITGAPSRIVMSEFGEGPLWVIDYGANELESDKARLFDLKNLTSYDVETIAEAGFRAPIPFQARGAVALTVSAAGDALCVSQPNDLSPVWRFSAGKIRLDGAGGKAGIQARIMPDGKSFLEPDAFYYEGRLRNRFESSPRASFRFTTSNDFVSLAPGTNAGPNASAEIADSMIASFHADGSSTPIARVPIAGLGAALQINLTASDVAAREGKPYLNTSLRAHYEPDSNVFSYIATGPDRLIFKRLEAELAEGQSARFTRGKPLQLKLPNGVSIRGAVPALDSAPLGMTITPDGTISWTAPADAPDYYSVVVGIARPNEVRRFYIVRLFADELRSIVRSRMGAPDAAPPPGIRTAGLDLWDPDQFTIELDRPTAFIVGSKAQNRGPSLREEPPTPGPDRYVPERAESRLVHDDQASRQILYRMPQNKTVAVNECRAPFRLVKAQGRSVAESIAVSIPKANAVIGLPEKATDVTPAGNGRYLLISQPNIFKVAVVDLREAKLLGYVDTDTEDFCIAGGLTRFVVLDKESRTLRCYELASLKLQKSMTVDSDFGRIYDCGMGARSEGPIYLQCASVRKSGEAIAALDLETFSVRKLDLDARAMRPHSDCELQVSADGTRLAFDDDSRNVDIFAPERDRLRLVRSNAQTSQRHRFSLGFAGEDVFRDDGREAPGGLELHIGTGPFLVAGQAYDGDLWFGAALNANAGRGTFPLQFYRSDDTRPLAQFTIDGGDFDPDSPLRSDRRVHVAGAEKAIAVVGEFPPRISLTRFDLDAATAANSTAPLIAKSAPPLIFPNQADLSYQIEVAGKPAGLKCRLVIGPADMTVSAAGLVKWRGPGVASGPYRGAIVVVSDEKGREFAHGFRVPSSATTDIAPTASAAPADAALAAGLFLPLPGPASQRAVAGDGRYLLLSFNACQKIAVFDLQTATILRWIETGTTKFFVAGGTTRMVVVDPAKRELKRYRLDSGALEQTEIYPGEPDGVAGATMGSASEGPLLMWDLEPLAGHATPLRIVELDTLKLRLTEALQGNSAFERPLPLHSLSASADGRFFTPVWRTSNSGYSAPAGPDSLRGISSSYMAAIFEVADPKNGRGFGANRRAHISKTGLMMINNSSIEARANYSHGNLSLKDRSTGDYVEDFWYSHDARAQQPSFKVYFHRARSLETLADMEVPLPWGAQGGWQMADAIYYSQPQKTLAIAYEAPSVLFVKRFDAAAEIKRRAVDHVAFTGMDLQTVYAGKKLSYQLTAIPNEPGMTFELREGPAGMTVSPSGLVEWTAPDDVKIRMPVQVAVKNARGKEAVDQFTLAAYDPAIMKTYFVPLVGPTKQRTLAGTSVVNPDDPLSRTDPSTPTQTTPAARPSGTARPTGTGPSATAAPSALSPAVLAAMRTQPRKWTSSNGATLIATFVERKGDTVTLRRTAGAKPLDVPIKQLSQSDQDFIEKIAPLEN